MSVSRPGLAVLTVQFKVGRAAHRGAGAAVRHGQCPTPTGCPKARRGLSPSIKPKGIDDVPIVTLTLFSKNPTIGAFDLERVAHSIEADLKRVSGTREVDTIGGPGRAVLRRDRSGAHGRHRRHVPDLRAALQSANLGLPVGELLVANRAVAVEAGPFLKDARDVAELVVGVRARQAGVPAGRRHGQRRPAAGRAAMSGTASPARTAASIRPSPSPSPRSRARTPSMSPTR